jgi:hypothetical protein
MTAGTLIGIGYRYAISSDVPSAYSLSSSKAFGIRVSDINKQQIGLRGAPNVSCCFVSQNNDNNGFNYKATIAQELTSASEILQSHNAAGIDLLQSYMK